MRISHKYNQPTWLECRSDKNGPLRYEEITVKGNSSIPDRQIPYKAAKPYTRADVFLDSSVPSGVPAGVSLLDLPTADDVVASLLSDEPTLASSVFQPFVDTSDIQNQALQNAIEYGNILLLVSMKEAGETIDMVYHVFVRLWRTITKMIHAARSLNLAVTINSLSDLWLEYRYGWRPFLGEISSIAKQLAHIRNPNVLSSYGGQSAPAATSVAQASSTVVTEHIRATVIHEIRPKSEISAKAGFNYVNNTDSRNTSTLALWGLDWHSLASTAWDLVPFSFVVDMFLNVSDVLQAHGIADEVKSFNGYISYTGEFRVVSKITSLQSSMPSTMRDYLSPSELIALGHSPFFAELFRVVDEQVRSLIFNSDGTYRSHKGYQTWTYYKDSESEALAAYQAQMTREGAYPVPDTVDLRRYGTSNYGVFFNSFFKWDKSDAAVKQIFTNKQGQIDYNARVIAVGATMYSFHELLGHLGQIADMVLKENWNLRFDVRLWDSKVPEFGYRAACTVDYSGSEKYIDLSGKEPTYSYDMSIFQRVLNSELKHTLQASADLSSGQYIDLAAIGWNLIKSIKS